MDKKEIAKKIEEVEATLAQLRRDFDKPPVLEYNSRKTYTLTRTKVFLGGGALEKVGYIMVWQAHKWRFINPDTGGVWGIDISPRALINLANTYVVDGVTDYLNYLNLDLQEHDGFSDALNYLKEAV